jgi:predicted phage terminase large subunit-like protein
MTTLQLPRSLAEVEAEKGKRSLRYFIERAWHVVEPQTPFLGNWHIDAIVEHLEAVTAGEIRDLVINIPPRCMKSLAVSVFWPVWEWTRAPATRWLFSSYVDTLCVRDAVKSRRIIQSQWFQERWGDVFNLTGDQNVKHRYENDKTGYRVSTSVGGAATGEGGDRIVADDPHNVKEGESELKREGAVTWWSEVMPTRRNQDTSARIVIMQRVHEEDVAGWSLEHGFQHLCLPMEYEGNRVLSPLGFEDPRDADNELLWSARFSRDYIDQLKQDLGPYGTASQLQQRPAPRGGGMFKRAWFEIVGGHDFKLNTRNRTRYWDKAGTEGGGAYTVGLLMCELRSTFYIEDVVRGQWGVAEREQTILDTTERDAEIYGVHGFDVWVEQEPGSGGKESAENTIRNLAGFAARADKPSGDKFLRADPLAGAAEAGNVKLVRGPWNEEFLQEMEMTGPGAKTLDQMDAAAGAFNKLARKRARKNVPVVSPASLGQANPFTFETV